MATGTPHNLKVRNAVPSMDEVIDAVEKLLRAALQKDRPLEKTESEAVDLYRTNNDSRQKTLAVLAACLSDWASFARQLDEQLHEEGPLTMDAIVAQFIHRVSLRKRRAHYREEKIGGQVRAANVRGHDGDWQLFDPEDPRKWEESLKDLREEIAYLLETPSAEDRLVIEMDIDGYTRNEIVKKVKEAFPNKRISEATVSRIVARFRDALRERLNENN